MRVHLGVLVAVTTVLGAVGCGGGLEFAPHDWCAFHPSTATRVHGMVQWEPDSTISMEGTTLHLKRITCASDPNGIVAVTAVQADGHYEFRFQADCDEEYYLEVVYPVLISRVQVNSVTPTWIGPRKGFELYREGKICSRGDWAVDLWLTGS